jgi:hypothetical protein
MLGSWLLTDDQIWLICLLLIFMAITFDTILDLIRQLLLIILQDLVQLFLPIPFFPELSKVLAKLVGLKPISKPAPKQKHTVGLPPIAIPKVLPVPLPNLHLPTIPPIHPLVALPEIMHKTTLTPDPLADDYARWDESKAYVERKRLELSIYAVDRKDVKPAEEDIPTPISPRKISTAKSPRKHVDDVDFTCPSSGPSKLTLKVKESIEHVVPHIPAIVTIPFRPIPVPRVQKPEERIEEGEDPETMTDNAFARLSAEKQVYEQSKGFSEPINPSSIPKVSHPPVSPKVSRPPTPPPKSLTSPKSASSTGSSLSFHAVAGEV